MATEQVFDWIKNEVHLSKTVNNFETDFANGYLFGEVLSSYGELADLSSFSKKGNKEAKVNNFYKVEDALRKLKIKFEGKQIHNIMNEERGAALRLLYQIKLALQKKMGGGPCDTEMLTTTGLKSTIIDKRIGDKMERTMAQGPNVNVQKIGGKDPRTNKVKREDAAMSKFQVTMNKQFDDAMNMDNREKDLINTIQQNQRSDNRQKLNENKTFLAEWEDEGRQNWKANQTRRKEAISKVKYFEDREVDIYKQRLGKELSNATHELNNGVNEFEKNLQKLGIEQNINMDDAIKRMEEKKGIPPGQIQNFSYAATMNKIKESKKTTDFAGKERERRRRKLMVDQANTQEKLDLTKGEDMMLERLLKQQESEQKHAYIKLHGVQCKAMVTANRAKEAARWSEIRQKKSVQLEQKRVEEANATEPMRRKQIDSDRKMYGQTRRADKQKVRDLNIEIASEIADLLLDCAEETFCKGTDNTRGQVSKEDWRSFMDIFKAGNKVSLRNLKKKPVQSETAIAAIDAINEKKLQFKGNQRVQELLKEYSTSQALEDFYQYLCCCGKFNLAELAGDHWSDFLALLPEDNKNLDSGLLGNPELYSLIGGVFSRQKLEKNKNIFAQAAASASIENSNVIPEEGGISQIEPLKVAQRFDVRLSLLGRAYSGKKTVAKILQNHFGGASAFKIFTIDEVLKEAMEYVSPKKQDDTVVDPKAKKAPAKGKAEDAAPVDVFEGKDTEEYKEIANQIRTEYFATEEDAELDKTRQNFFVSSVLDDNLLVQLFVKRLELQFGEGKSQYELDQELRDGVVREQEIVQQLKEFEEQAHLAAGGKDDKAKGGKGAPKGGKTQEEMLREELEAIRSVKMSGWVLLDFPQTLNQMKLLEKAISGYESKVDVMKSEQDELEEAQQKIILALEAPQQCVTMEPVRAIESGLDGVVFLDTPLEECIRRGVGRKIDPTTGTIYHLEDNMPEDPKVKERLQDHKDERGEETRIRDSSAKFNQTASAIKVWSSQFGQYAPMADECSIKNNIEVCSEHWNNHQLVEEAVMGQMGKLVEFKQHLYNLQRTQMREKVLEEQEEARIEEERKALAASEAKDDADSKQDEPKITQNSLDVTPHDVSSKMLTGREGQTHGLTDGGKERCASDLGMLSSQHNETVTQRSQMKSSILMQRVYEISDNEKAKRWPRMLAQYYKSGMQNFHLLRLQRQTIFRNLNDNQKTYIEYLMRPSSQQDTINEFCESYNRFATEFPELRGNPSTREELLNRVDILSHNLWQVIMQRKSESMAERERLMEGGWVHLEMNNLCTYTCYLIENEFLRLSAVTAMVTGYVINEDVDAVGLFNRLSERNITHLEHSADGNCNSPLLDQVSSQVINQVDAYLSEAQGLVKLEPAVTELLLKEQRNFNFRLNQLKTHSLLLLNEISIYAHQVFDVLDDWVVVAVEQENEGVQEVVREIRMAVKTNQSYIESFIINEANLFNLIETIKFSEGPPLYIQDLKIPCNIADRRFTVEQLTAFYNDFKRNAAFDNILDTQSFTTLLVTSIQAHRVPKNWQYMAFDNFGQFARKFKKSPLADDTQDMMNESQQLFGGMNGKATVEKRTFVDWKLVMLAFILLNSSQATETQLNSYFGALREASKGNDLVSLEEFLQVRAWFDVSEGTHDQPEGKRRSDQESDDDGEEEGNLDIERVCKIKTLLYNTLRQTNQAGLKVSTLEASLSALARATDGSPAATYGQAIFS